MLGVYGSNAMQYYIWDQIGMFIVAPTVDAPRRPLKHKPPSLKGSEDPCAAI